MFTVSRLQNSNSSSNLNLNNVNSSSSSVEPSNTLQELARNDYFRIFKLPSNLPRLKLEEAVIYGYTDDSCRKAVLITNQRIIIYSYTSWEIDPITFEFEYNKNEYGIIPQVKLIPNVIYENEPGLVIADSITGSVTFIESINSAPSLDILNNKHQLKLKLSNGEFITIAEYFQDIGLIIVTNYKKVTLVTFKDQFGKNVLSSIDIQSPRSFFGLFNGSSTGSSQYDLESYDSSNKIISVKLYHESPLRQKLSILEEDGKFSLIDFVKNSSPTSIVQSNIKAGLYAVVEEHYRDLSGDLKIKDLEPLGDDKYLILAAVESSSTRDQTLILFTIDSLTSDVFTVTSHYKISNNSTVSNYPKLYTVRNNSIASVVSDNTITVISLNSGWEDFIQLKNEATILGFGLEQGQAINLITETGILKVEVLVADGKLSPMEFIKSHIEQALQFDSSSTPLNFSLKDSTIEISAQDIEYAILTIANDILSNKLPMLTSYPLLETCLQKRCDVIKKLCTFISTNFEISADLKLLVTNITEKVYLSNKFFTLLESFDLVKVIEPIIASNFNNSTINDFFNNSVHSIVDLIAKFVQKSIEIGQMDDLLTFSDFLYKLFSSGYVAIEQDIKSNLFGLEFDDVKQSIPMFLDSYYLLQDVNQVLKTVTSNYADQLESPTEIDIKMKVSEIILNLSLFLYCTSNNLLQYLSTRPKTAENDGLRESFESLVSQNREGWINIFILSKKQDYIIPLIEAFQDLESLSECLESERELVYTLDNQTAFDKDQLEINMKFRFYFNKFGYRFAETLFTYYIKVHKINLILTQFHDYKEYLTKFLDSSYKNARFSWILDMFDEKYSLVAKRLIQYVTLATDEKIENKKLQLNLAKLSLIALDTATESEERDVDILLDEIESNLASIELQMNYEFLILSSFIEINDEIIDRLICKSSYLLENKFSGFQSELTDVLIKLDNKVQLSIVELVQLLTLLNFDDTNTESFDNLFKLLSILKDSTSSPMLQSKSLVNYKLNVLERLVWKRLLLLNNWDDLMTGVNVKKNSYLTIMSNLSNYNVQLPDSVNELIFTEEDLKCLETVDESLYADYFKENQMLTKLDQKIDLNKWLRRKY